MIEIVQTIILIIALGFAVGAYFKAWLTEQRLYSSNERLAGWIRAVNRKLNDIPASQTEIGQKSLDEDTEVQVIA